MSHIFISYSKKNREYARNLADDLLQRGFDVWIDDEIEPSEDWWRNIRQAIRDCDAFTIVMTPESEASHWVQLELLHALEFKKPIFPLFHAGDPNPLNSDTWSRIANIQFTNVQQGNLPNETWYSKLITRGISNKPSGGSIVTPQIDVNQLTNDLRKWIGQASILKRLPEPFEWCEIPMGNVSLESDKIYEVLPFAIAKYPITNAQFQIFINDPNGYSDVVWWNFSKEAQTWRTANPEPEKTAFSGDDLPRTKVCWYEAVAFCRWLSVQLEGKILLPTEQQWQRAAQGDDLHVYPWGSQFNPSNCNTEESGLKKTTSVTRYPNGASLYGVMDMSGNVWEWCLNEYKAPDNPQISGREMRVLRGGSWLGSQDGARVTTRDYHPPNVRGSGRGFRIIATL
jgi:hypothetical protein